MDLDNSNRQVRIAFVVGALRVGGAEMMLFKLLSRIDRTRFEPCVIALSGHSDNLLQMFESAGVNCRLLGMKSRADVLSLFRLRATLRAFAPDIVQGWMYYGNLVASLGAAILKRQAVPVLWSIRGSLNLAQEKWLSAFTIWLGGKLSFLATKIINNSRVSAVQHEQRLGYTAANRVTLPNGFDTGVFQPSEKARVELRRALGLPEESLLIGLIANYRPMKDHDCFLRAAALLSAAHQDVHYLLAGQEINAGNTRLVGSSRVDLQACKLEYSIVSPK